MHRLQASAPVCPNFRFMFGFGPWNNSQSTVSQTLTGFLLNINDNLAFTKDLQLEKENIAQSVDGVFWIVSSALDATCISRYEHGVTRKAAVSCLF